MLKKLSILVLLIAFSCGKPDKNLDATLNKYSDVAYNVKLQSIQDKVHHAFDRGVTSKSDQELKALYAQLNDLDNEAPYDLVKYWKGYTEYYVFLLSTINDNDKIKSKKILEKAINDLEQIVDKNSEEVLLQSRLKAHSIAYNTSKAPVLAAQVKTNLDRVSRVDPNNIRLKFLKSNFLYYNPQRKDKSKITTWLSSIIDVPRAHTDNHLPNWGREESYSLLVSYYKKIGQQEKADQVAKKGLIDFPTSLIVKNGY